MHRDEFLLESNRTDEVEKERLAGAIFPNDEPERRTTGSDALDIFDKGTQFLRSANLNKVLANARYYSRTKGL
jgi:hypothetical protein